MDLMEVDDKSENSEENKLRIDFHSKKAYEDDLKSNLQEQFETINLSQRKSRKQKLFSKPLTGCNVSFYSNSSKEEELDSFVHLKTEVPREATN